MMLCRNTCAFTVITCKKAWCEKGLFHAEITEVQTGSCHCFTTFFTYGRLHSTLACVPSYQGSWGRCWVPVCGWTLILWEFWPPLRNLRHTQTHTKLRNESKVREFYSLGVRRSDARVPFSSVGRQLTKQRLQIPAAFLGSRPQLPWSALC